jgi:phage FluMu gp28-like protein
MWAKACQLVIDSMTTVRTWNHPEALMLSQEMKFVNGSWIKALPSNPDTISGYSANVIWDEAAKHDKARELWRNFYPSITNPLRGTYKVRIASTPMGRENKFAEIWHGDNKEKVIKWSKHRTDIYEAVRNGLCPKGMTPDEFLAELRDGFDDADGWAQEYECEFLDGSNVLLPYELITECESVEASTISLAPITGTYCGIDFGRTSDPTVCWTLQRVGDVLWTRDVKVIYKTGTPEQNDILRANIKASRRTCIDWTGPGVGFGDYAAREFTEWNPAEHKFGKVENCTFSINFKREIFPALLRRFEQKKIRIPVDRLIREDLHAMQQCITNGQYNYWAPRGKEGHSDRCTALALAIRAAGSDGGMFIPKASGGSVSTAGSRRNPASRTISA